MEIGIDLLRKWRGPDLFRYGSHLSILALTLLLASFGHFNLPRVSSGGKATSNSKTAPLPSQNINSPSETGFLTKEALPFTIIPERPRREVITYIVQPRDTVSGVAEKFGLGPETVLWSNPELERNPDLLSVGQELFILPLDGVYHTVESGDTLEKIAQDYKIEVAAITESEYNRLTEPYTLEVGQKIVVPGGSKPYVPHVVQAIYAGPPPAGAAQGTGNFMWPTSGVITQRYWGGHRAVDIGAPTGTPVYASDSGYVAEVGWMEGYGNHILISHGNGWETLYAHLSQILVNAGTSVQKGQMIGRVGTTGRTTGPHLHFEIRQYGVKRNPFGFLP